MSDWPYRQTDPRRHEGVWGQKKATHAAPFDTEALASLVAHLMDGKLVAAEKILGKHPEFLGPGAGFPPRPEPPDNGDIQDWDVEPLIQHFLSVRRIDLVQWCIDHGAQIALTKEQEGPECSGVVLSQAISAGLPYFKLLIEFFGDEVLNIEMVFGDTALALVLTDAKIEFAAYIFTRRPDLLTEPLDCYGHPLPLAYCEQLMNRNLSHRNDPTRSEFEQMRTLLLSIQAQDAAQQALHELTPTSSRRPSQT